MPEDGSNGVRAVVLPDGVATQVAFAEQTWWHVHGSSGYVPPSFLAPCPNQSRTHIGKEEFASLCGSVSECGVRQPIIVTPIRMAPWIVPDAKHKGAHFVVVSGHRRRAAALETRCPAVPVNVRVYRDESAFWMDVSLLNTNHDDLSELEMGLDILRLSKGGVTYDKIARFHGLSMQTLQNRLALTRLHPDVQKQLSPELQEKKRLPTTVAVALGNLKAPTTEELQSLLDFATQWLSKDDPILGLCADSLNEHERRFAMQKALLGVCQRRGLNAARSIEFILSRKLETAAGSHGHGRPVGSTERFQPRRRQDIVKTWLTETCSSVVLDWSPQELLRILGSASYEEVSALINQTGEALELLKGFAAQLGKILKDKKPTSPEVLALLNRGRGRRG